MKNVGGKRTIIYQTSPHAKYIIFFFQAFTTILLSGNYYPYFTEVRTKRFSDVKQLAKDNGVMWLAELGFEPKSKNPKSQLFSLNQGLSNKIIMTHSNKYILLHDTVYRYVSTYNWTSFMNQYLTLKCGVLYFLF